MDSEEQHTVVGVEVWNVRVLLVINVFTWHGANTCTTRLRVHKR